jgi:hypothetical protein
MADSNGSFPFFGVFSVLTVILLAILVKFLPSILSWLHLKKESSKISGPPQWPLIGVAHHFLGKNTHGK